VRIPCEIFVPAAVGAVKTAQIEAHGATVVRVEGTREDTAATAIAFVRTTGAFYASHVYNSFFLEGTKTYAYEIWEEIGVPDILVVPVGNGTLLLGALLGFDELRRSGLTDRSPKVVAVQATGCSPLARSFRHGGAPVDTAPTGTIADGIAIAAPARGAQIIAAMRDVGGVFVDVNDDAVLHARSDLARQGLFASRLLPLPGRRSRRSAELRWPRWPDAPTLASWSPSVAQGSRASLALRLPCVRPDEDTGRRGHVR
jgi:threonine synthase